MNYKELGNQSIAKGNFKEAVEYYTKGIQKEPLNNILFSNRSGAYLKIGQLELSLEDAKKCLEIDPKWIKGYFRVASAQLELGLFEETLETIEKGFLIEKNNESLTIIKTKCEEKMEKYWEKNYKPEISVEIPKIIQQILDFYSDISLEGVKLTQFNEKHILPLIKSLYDRENIKEKKNVLWILTNIKEFSRVELRYIASLYHNIELRSFIDKIYTQNLTQSLPVIKMVMRKVSSLEISKCLNIVYKEKEEKRKIVIDTILDIQKFLGDYWASFTFYNLILFTNDTSLISYLKKFLKAPPNKSNLFYKIIKKFDLINENLNDNFMKKCSECGKVSYLCKSELKEKTKEWRLKGIENAKKFIEKGDYSNSLKCCYQNYCLGEESDSDKALRIKSLINLNQNKLALFEMTQLEPIKRKELINLIKVHDQEVSTKFDTKVHFAWESNSSYSKDYSDKITYIMGHQHVLAKKSNKVFDIRDKSSFTIQEFDKYYIFEDILVTQKGSVLKFYNMKDKKEIKTLTLPHYAKIREFSFNGKYLCLWRQHSNALWFELYNYENLKLVKEVFGPFKNPLRENFSHYLTNNYLFASNTDGVYKFDLETGNMVESYIFSSIDELYNEKILSIQVHDTFLFVVNQTGVQIWNHENGGFIRQINSKEEIISFHYFYDYVILQNPKSIIFYDIKTGNFEYDLDTDMKNIYVKDYEHYSVIYGISKNNLKQFYFPKTKDEREKKCSSCKKKILTKKVCGKCFQNYYCSKECQINDWNSSHKTNCVPVKLSKNFK